MWDIIFLSIKFKLYLNLSLSNPISVQIYSIKYEKNINTDEKKNCITILWVSFNNI